MTRRIRIPHGVGGFQEDKELAREIRLNSLLPALADGERVQLDFAEVSFATQSFVHALIGEAIKRYGEDVLDRLEFQNCSPQLKSVIELVVNYSLGGFAPVPEDMIEEKRQPSPAGSTASPEIGSSD